MRDDIYWLWEAAIICWLPLLPNISSRVGLVGHAIAVPLCRLVLLLSPHCYTLVGCPGLSAVHHAHPDQQRGCDSSVANLDGVGHGQRLCCVLKRSTGCCLQVTRLQNAWRGLRAIREAQRELLLLQLQRFETQRTGRQSRFAEEPAEAAASTGSAGAQVSWTQWGGSPLVGAAPAAAAAVCMHSPPDVPTANAALSNGLRRQELLACWGHR